MSKYDIITTCPICGDSITWTNGATNAGKVYIKTKRKSVLVIHENCIQNERSVQNGHIKSKENK